VISPLARQVMRCPYLAKNTPAHAPPPEPLTSPDLAPLSIESSPVVAAAEVKVNMGRLEGL
jgi:hypothetical protein